MADKKDQIEQSEDQPLAPGKSSKKGSKHVVTAIVVGVVCALLAAGGTWYYMDTQATKQQQASQAKIDDLTKKNQELTKANQKLVTAAKAAAKTTTTTATVVADPALKTKLTETMNSGNTAAIESNMAASVSYATAASGNVGTTGPVGAVQQLDYFKDSKVPWNFDIPAATLNTYKAGSYKDYLADDVYFGASADGMFVSFRTNSAGKIDQIFMAASVDLLK